MQIKIGKALDRLSHIRHTSTVFTVFVKVFYRRQSVFREHILKKDTLPCLIVESSSGKKEESVRKKDISLSAEKESLKGSRKEQTVGKSVKERKTSKG